MYKQRNKLISVRVNSQLLEQVKRAIDKKTNVVESWGNRKVYYYRDSNRPHAYDKFTIADLLEEAMEKYLEEQTPSAQK